MKAEYLDQTCATEDASLAVYRQIVIPNLLLRCREFGGDASAAFHFLPLEE